jgi:hypothetical protein
MSRPKKIAKAPSKSKSRRGRAAPRRQMVKEVVVLARGDGQTLRELAKEFAQQRETDERKLTPLQRRMVSGGA